MFGERPVTTVNISMSTMGICVARLRPNLEFKKEKEREGKKIISLKRINDIMREWKC